MPYYVKLTDIQSDIFHRAYNTYKRNTGVDPAGFKLNSVGCELPDSETSRLDFVRRGLWKVEPELIAERDSKAITATRYATLTKSLKNLEDKIENPGHYDGRSKRS